MIEPDLVVVLSFFLQFTVTCVIVENSSHYYDAAVRTYSFISQYMSSELNIASASTKLRRTRKTPT
jgi:hypothetical protein